MRPVNRWMTVCLWTYVWLGFTICVVGSANAQSLEAEREILDTIGDFAERICPRVPLEGSSNTVELSGSAKADLNGLLRRMASLGIQGAAKYQESQFQGLVQKDLLAALRDTTDCKLKVAQRRGNSVTTIASLCARGSESFCYRRK